MRDINVDHFFVTLGNKQRAKTILLLNSEGPLSVSEIVSKLNLEQSAVSHNLKQLLACHFVSVKRSGKKRIYSLNEDTVKPLLAQIEKHVSKYCVKECNHNLKKEAIS